VAKAIWNGAVIAQSDDVEIVEGNVYFSSDGVNREYLQESNTHTLCPWKGTASYYHVAVNGKINPDAAWYYPEPKSAAKHVKDRIAFWHGVTVER
jgi:uncharacterized protein (DUF427 family)